MVIKNNGKPNFPYELYHTAQFTDIVQQTKHERNVILLTENVLTTCLQIQMFHSARVPGLWFILYDFEYFWANFQSYFPEW